MFLWCVYPPVVQVIKATVTAPVTAVVAVGQGTIDTLYSCKSSERFKFACPTVDDLRHCAYVGGV